MSDASLDARVERVAAKLRAVLDGGFRPFGWESGPQRLRPPLAEAEVAEFERRHGVELPAGYRAFITRVGDGGAGPAYGLYSLADALAKEHRPPVPDDFLRTPFPHVRAWNPDHDEELDASWEQEDREVSEEEARRRYLFIWAGTLALCHEGCGYLHLLVVTGPTRGQMWLDGNCSDGGFVPLGVDFLEWYERWLDATLAGGHGTWWLEASREGD